jgi:hypothetical protein
MERFGGYCGQEPLYVGVRHKTILEDPEAPIGKYDKPIDVEVELAEAELEFGHLLAERSKGKEKKHKFRNLQKEIGLLRSIIYEDTGEGSYVLRLIKNNKSLEL